MTIETIGKRDILDYWDLSDDQRRQAAERYGGLVELEDQSYIALADDELIILGDIVRVGERIGRRRWHGVHNDGFSSGTLYMLSADGEKALVARYYS